MDSLLSRLGSLAGRILDIVLPRRARRIRAERLGTEDLMLSPMMHQMLGQEIATLAPYDILRDLIQSLKYDRSTKSAYLLSSALAEYLREDIASKKLFSTKQILLIPVPLHSKRKRDRGYNQIALVIDALPEEFKNGVLSRIGEPLLERTRETQAQTKLTRNARLSNVVGAFAVSDPALIKNMHVYLIDDVATTGATLVNAGHALTRSGAEVTLLALARA